jgi:serine/threonine protein phosphatase PrpC
MAQEKQPPSSVKDYGVFSDQNWQHRRRMEDAHCIQDAFAGDPNSGFFAVYDGHGGKEAAIFSSNNLHKVS